MPPSRQPHIGTLNEGSLHRGLKDWLAQPGDRFEVPLGQFVIDIVRGDLLIEIQTGSIGAMGHKLDRLLDDHRIRIVRPIAATRWFEQPGKKRRKSPKRQHLWSIFDEMVSIPTLLEHPNLELQVLLIEESEVRSATDRVRRGQRGRVVDRRLDTVIEQHLITSLDQMLAVLPGDLDQPFGTAELAKAAGIPRDLAQRVCYVLRHAGLIDEVQRTRAGILYRRKAAQNECASQPETTCTQWSGR